MIRPIARWLDAAPAIGQGRHLARSLFGGDGVSRIATRGGMLRVRRVPCAGAPRLVFGVDGPNVIEQYDALIATCAGRADLTILEPPGTGGSPPARGFTYTLDAFAGAIGDALATLVLGPVTLVFPCYLGYVAAMLARDLPDQVARVVLVQAPRWQDMEAWTERMDPRRQLRRPVIGQIAVRVRRLKIARLWYRLSAGSRARADALAGPALGVLRAGGCFCLASQMQGLSRAPFVARPFAAPALVVWGERDRTHHGSQPDAAWPGATVVRMTDCGHSPELEDPANFAAAVLG